MKNYKLGISDHRLDDEPFSLLFDFRIHLLCVSGVKRGDFHYRNIPFGFYLTGFNNTVCIVVQYVSLQDGTYDITVTKTSSDEYQISKTINVPLIDLVERINEMVNTVYFA